MFDPKCISFFNPTRANCVISKDFKIYEGAEGKHGLQKEISQNELELEATTNGLDYENLFIVFCVLCHFFLHPIVKR